MRNNYKFLSILSVIVLFSQQSWAMPYFSGDTISPTLIDKPLAKDSQDWKDEVNQIVEMQKNPDPKQIAQAATERDFQSETVVQVVEPNFNRSNYPQLYKLMDNVGDTTKLANDNAKTYWHTNRPYVDNKNVKALIAAHKNPAYPSGHTAGSYVDAYVLGMLLPEKRDQFYLRAAQIAWHRVLVGMHYPNDIKGGRQLALLVMGGLLQNPQFQKDFEAAKAELAKKH